MSIHTPLHLAALAALTAALAGTAVPAHAAEKSIVSSTLVGGLGYAGTADDNTVRVTLDGSRFTIDDTVAITPGAGCRSIAGDPTRATCTAFRLVNGAFRSFNLSGRGGDDTLINLTPAPMLAAGNDGDDKLSGGLAADTLLGGDGVDTIRGGRGDDVVRLDAGSDQSVWDAGDGNDRLDGGDGFDTLTVTGSAADEQLRLAANGVRARLTRDIGATAIDVGTVERVDANALGGRDTLTIDDLTGTGVQEARLDLEAVKNGGTPDTDADQVILHGTDGTDVASFAGQPGNLLVLGLPAFVTIQRAEATRDTVSVNALQGDDRIDAGSQSSNAIPLTLDGGAGKDTLFGSGSADLMVGGDGNDFIDGGRGNDVALLGEGSDTFVTEAGDGSDVVEGGAGTDGVRVSGSAASEQFAASAAGIRTRLTRQAGGSTDVIDAAGVESVSQLSLGGADTLTVNDLAGTGVTLVDASLFDFGVPGGNNDTVVVSGTAAADTVTAVDANGVVEVTGLAARVRVTGTDPAGDRLELNGFGGDDTIDSAGLSRLEMQVRADGGANNDSLLGGDGDDVLAGGSGDDVVFAGSGDNVAFGNAGDDVLRGEEGDDVLDGGADDDILIGNGGDDVLLNGEVIFDF